MAGAEGRNDLGPSPDVALKTLQQALTETHLNVPLSTEAALELSCRNLRELLDPELDEDEIAAVMNHYRVLYLNHFGFLRQGQLLARTVDDLAAQVARLRLTVTCTGAVAAALALALAAMLL